MRSVTTTLHTDLAKLRLETVAGSLARWSELVDADPCATFFQRPEWCLAWYEAYAGRFSPLVLAVQAGGELVGLASLAVESSTRRLVFTGDAMADYRDVVAPDPWREEVLDALMHLVGGRRFAEPFVVGYTQPESRTVPILGEARHRGWPRGISRSHPCNRFMFDADGENVRELLAKQSIRRHLNFYRKHGGLTLERIRDASRWDEVRQVFFDHHSLRQLAVGRRVSFTDPAKQAFFSALLRNAPEYVHFTVLLAGDRIVAEHFGFVSRGQILLGAPAFDPLEERRAPAQLLLALIAEQAAKEGLLGLDLTIGESSFKERFGNQTLQLPSIALYRSPVRFLLRRSRDAVVTQAKRQVMRHGGSDRWQEFVTRVSRAETASGRPSSLWWGGGAWQRTWAHPATPQVTPALRADQSPDLLHCVAPVGPTIELLHRVSSRRREGDALVTVQGGGGTVFAALVHEGDVGSDAAVPQGAAIRLLTQAKDRAAATVVLDAVAAIGTRAGLAAGAPITLVIDDGRDSPLARELLAGGWHPLAATDAAPAQPSTGEEVA